MENYVISIKLIEFEIFVIIQRSVDKWKSGALGYEGKWTKKQKAEISVLLMNSNKTLPNEINRNLRPLDDFCFWKAAEFRTILLYVGMVVFKNYLRPEIYDQFLLLSCSVTICSSDEYKTFLPKAREMFEEYVEYQRDFYGAHSLTSNFHNLIHVVDDVQRFGNLNRMSTYPFENCLGKIKSKLKLRNKPLEQVARRMIEIANAGMMTVNFDKKFVPSVKYRQYFSDNSTLIAFREINVSPNVLLSNRKFGDRFFLTINKEIVEMQYVFIQNGEYFIRGIPITDKRCFFKYPFSSQFINIYQSNLTKDSVRNYKLSDFNVKLVCLSIGTEYVFIPLLHTYKSN